MSFSLLLAAQVILPIAFDRNSRPVSAGNFSSSGKSENSPDVIFQYYHKIRADENGVVHYPIGYWITEFQHVLARSKNADGRHVQTRKMTLVK